MEAMIKINASALINVQFIFNCLRVVRVRGNTFFVVREKKLLILAKPMEKKTQKMGKLKFKVAAALHEDYRQVDQIFFKEI